jgi:hypothetical protein
VVLNPIARAFAKDRLKRLALNHRIGMMMLVENEYAASEAIAMSFIVHALMACLQEMGESDSVDFRMLKSASVVLTDLSKRNFAWRKADAITLDNAMEICVKRWAGIDPDLLQKHIYDLEQIDKKIQLEQSEK